MDGVNEREAAFAPRFEEWSTKETLVHLIHVEREFQQWINDLVVEQERFSEECSGNQLFRIRLILVAFPTVNELIAELRRSFKETVAMVAFIDPDFTRRKTSYWRLGSELMSSQNHTKEHFHQIENNLQAARSVNLG